jgi:hypothetical protein
MQLVIVGCVLATMRFMEQTPIVSILTRNAVRGASVCGLNDSCVLFSMKLPAIATVASVVLGLVAVAMSSIAKQEGPKVKNAVLTVRHSIRERQRLKSITPSPTSAAALPAQAARSFCCRRRSVTMPCAGHEHLTSFEKHGLGAPFQNL